MLKRMGKKNITSLMIVLMVVGIYISIAKFPDKKSYKNNKCNLFSSSVCQ